MHEDFVIYPIIEDTIGQGSQSHGTVKIIRRISNSMFIIQKTEYGQSTFMPLFVYTYHVNKTQMGMKVHSDRDFSKLETIPAKLRYLRTQKELIQKEVADYIGVYRTTYSEYEEDGHQDYYPPEILQRLADLYEISIEDLLDEYNLFLYKGQGDQIRQLRTSMELTRNAFGKLFNVPSYAIKRWETNKTRITKKLWEKVFGLN
jgi:transcriptional regulator with XRE-family HTH domain